MDREAHNYSAGLPTSRLYAPRKLTLGKDGCYYYFTEDVISTSHGEEYRVTRANKMPRIDDRILYSVFYLYHSEEEAKVGANGGGSGFLVSIASEIHLDQWDVYAVTCKHVIQEGATVIRMEAKPGYFPSIRNIVLARNQWECSETDDIAVAYLGRKYFESFGHQCIPSFTLLTEDVMDEFDMGLGEDVYMVGRYVHHDGGKYNRPSVRSGIISIMPDENNPIVIEWDEQGQPAITQEAFLIELRSISGYSGAPVIWKLPVTDIIWGQVHFERKANLKDSKTITGPWMIGIQCAVFDEKLVSVVIPAWRLLEMLDREDFVIERKEEDEKATERRNASPVKLTSHKPEPPIGVTESEFMSALRKTSQKLSESDHDKKE